tara:strand:- start:385 stop:1215 length:831 start_codon:yes stop_codon:yes gene_type:complete
LNISVSYNTTSNQILNYPGTTVVTSPKETLTTTPAPQNFDKKSNTAIKVAFVMPYSKEEFEVIKSNFTSAIVTFLHSSRHHVQIESVAETPRRSGHDTITVQTRVAAENQDELSRISREVTTKNVIGRFNSHLLLYNLRPCTHISMLTNVPAAPPKQEKHSAPSNPSNVPVTSPTPAMKRKKLPTFKTIIIILACISVWTVFASAVVILFRRFRTRNQSTGNISESTLESIQIQLAEDPDVGRESEPKTHTVDLQKAMEQDTVLHRRNSRRHEYRV